MIRMPFRTRLAVLALLVAVAPAWSQQAPRLADQLPAGADLALSADVSGLLQGLKPEVVATVVNNHLGRFLGEGFPDPSKDIQQLAIAASVKGPQQTQAVGLVASKAPVPAIVEGLRKRIPGNPAPTTWVCRGLTLTSVSTPDQRSVSLAELADGNRFLARHPASDNSMVAGALASLGDTTKSYAAAHPGAFPVDALMAAHVANPPSLATFPKMAKAPWANVAVATMSIRKSPKGYRLDGMLELTSWLKAKIIQPFISSAIAKAAANPKVPPPARALVSRLAVTVDGKVFRMGVEATAQEIEALLLSLPGHEAAGK